MRWFSILVITALVGCKVQPPASSPGPVAQLPSPEEPIASDIPGWVGQKPVSSAEYVGVGNASLRDPDYQSTAKVEALDDLVSEISVQISSSSLLHQIENQSSFRESYQASVKATTSQEIEGYELHASWKGDQQYWVQYRLSKSKFEQLRNEKKQKVIEIARSNFLAGIEAESSGDFIDALHFFSRCIEDLKDRLNERNETEIAGKTILLAGEAYKRLITIIGGFDLKPNEDSIFFDSTGDKKTVTISASCFQKPVKNLPVTLVQDIQKKELVTSSEGTVSYSISGKQTGGGRLTAAINLSFLDSYQITRQLLKNYQIQELEISISVNPVSFFIQSDEKNQGTQIKPILAPLFSKILSENGTTIGTKNSSEYILLINSETRNGTETSGLFSTYLDFTIDIQNKSGQTVYSDSFSDIKGLHTSYKKSGIKAYQQVESELKDQITDSLNKNFFNK